MDLFLNLSINLERMTTKVFVLQKFYINRNTFLEIKFKHTPLEDDVVESSNRILFDNSNEKSIFLYFSQTIGKNFLNFSKNEESISLCLD